MRERGKKKGMDRVKEDKSEHKKRGKRERMKKKKKLYICIYI